MTMLPDTYREQIRDLVDAVDDPTVTDVVFAVSTRTASCRPSRTRRVASAASWSRRSASSASCSRMRDDGPNRPASVHPAVTPTVPASCVVGVDGSGGCSMRPTKASRYLGFRARLPKSVPQGWVVERKQLRVYRDPLPAARGSTADGRSNRWRVYNQVVDASGDGSHT